MRRQSKSWNNRRTRRGRTPKLGAYLLLTDAEKTEFNYLVGFRDSLNGVSSDDLLIMVKPGVRLKDMISLAEEMRGSDSRFREV